ncbi:MAG: hypothetical protein V3U10_00280 [Bacteroidota bacterium]
MAKRSPELHIAPTDHSPRRMFYDGDIQVESVLSGTAYRPVDPRQKKRKLSTFNVIVSLFVLALAAVLYVSNIIAVSHLSTEINTLEKRYQIVVNSNELLRAELNRKSSLERISRIAEEELGLNYPQEQPLWLEIDEELIERLESN